MNIHELYDSILEQASIISKVTTSSHLPKYIISSIETELLLGGVYEGKTPPTYPSGYGEEQGLRKLHQPANITYKNYGIRIGITELHLTEKNLDNNIKSLIMLYSKGLQKENKSGIDMSTTNTFAGLVCAHENGVISTGLINNLFSIVLSFYPTSRENFGGQPYPKDRAEVEHLFSGLIKQAGMHNIPELSFIGDLFFLIKELV
ncbi:Uncharacterised protein [Candidatus Tiddalikarchaeum anstoanum]|nr:Uncharacterised protein [Candidatus Tiddalikarchaeum anstoanum]